MNKTEKLIFKEVKKLRKAYRLPKKITFIALKQCIFSLGYKIYTYSEGKHLMEKLNLIEKSRHFSAMTVTSQHVRLVFIADCRSESEQALLLAHELGHIILKHHNIRQALHSDIQEYEANTFAALLLSPPSNHLALKIFRISLEFCVLILCVIILFEIHSANAARMQTKLLMDFNKQRQTLPVSEKPSAAEHLNLTPTKSIPKPLSVQTPEPPVQQSTTEEIPTLPPEPETNESLEEQKFTEEVVVTKTGKKYHLPNCGHLKNSTETRTITRTDAEKQCYTSCADCF